MDTMDEFCRECGAAYREDDKFCAKCGDTREAPASDSTPMGGDPKAAPPAPRQAQKAIPVVLAMTLLPIALLIIVGGGDCGSAEGEMRVTGGPHGDFTFTSEGCANLQLFGRMGANVHGHGSNDGAVYVVRDLSDAATVELEVPGSCQNRDGTDCTVFSVPRASCSVHDVQVEHTNTTVNDVRLVQGHAELVCELPDGTLVRGRVDFDDC